MIPNSAVPARFHSSELIIWHGITETNDNKQNENLINANVVVSDMTLVAGGVGYFTSAYQASSQFYSLGPLSLQSYQ